MYLRTLTLAALLMLLAACGDISVPTSTPARATQTPDASAQTTPGTVSDELGDNSQPPTFQSGRGAIRGVLQDMEGRPVVGLAIYLARVLPGDAGKAIQYSETGSPQSITDHEGRFTFNNIEPSASIAPKGYSLMTWTPVQTKLVPEPGGAEGSAVLIEVKANEITEAGILHMIPPE